MNMTEIYDQASGVDLEEQKRLWDERGRGYYGEYLVFSKVFELCSDQAKILTNVHVPIDGKSTEIDVLLIDTYGMISFEVKHYKGAIYGNSKDRQWTQFFRTVKNERFNSPILQNDHHVEALRKWFPEVPMYSFIVFTNEDVILKVENTRSDVQVCRLNELDAYLRCLNSQERKLSDDEIDRLFISCSYWVDKGNNTVVDEGAEKPLGAYLGAFREDIRAKEKAAWKKKASPLSVILTVLGALLIALGIYVSYRAVSQSEENDARVRKAEAEARAVESDAAERIRAAESAAEKDREEKREMKEKVDRYFSEASWNNDGNLQLAEDFVTVSNLKIEKMKDLDKGTRLSFNLIGNGEDYALNIKGENEIILLLKDGTSTGGKLSDFTSDYIGNWLYNGLGLMSKFLIVGVDPDEIQYIKIIGLRITKAPEIYITAATGYELEIYNADK